MTPSARAGHRVPIVDLELEPWGDAATSSVADPAIRDSLRSVAPADPVYVVATVHGAPVGVRWSSAAEVGDVEALRRRLRDELSVEVARHADADRALALVIGENGELPPCRGRLTHRDGDVSVTVVVCTCGRPNDLRRCLGSLMRCRYPDVEVLVVDNAPEDPATAHVVSEFVGREVPVRRVAEPRRGLAHARNCGVAAARGDVVAFTDDDVVVEPDWVSALAAAFRERDVVCVTGLVLPAELDTQPQRWFEEYGHFGKGYEPVVYGLDDSAQAGRMYPFTAGQFGTGANMAVRREFVPAVGGFDVALGAGTRCGGGEDLDIFLEVLFRGGRIAYDPRAVVRHAHRRDYLPLRRQIRSHGSGLSAVMFKRLLDDGAQRRRLLRALPTGLRYAFDPRSEKNARKPRDYPLRLTVEEWWGLAVGPFAYLRDRSISG